MALEKKEKLTPLQRLRILILGRGKPNRVTRISVGIGFLIWVYLISWQLLVLMALLLMKSLDSADAIIQRFKDIGADQYHDDNILPELLVNTIVQLVAFVIVLVALILIYRKKRIGFLLYVIGNFIILASTPLILGFKYFQHEMSYSYVIILGITSLYFLIGALWFYRWKPKQKTENSYNA